MVKFPFHALRTYEDLPLLCAVLLLSMIVIREISDAFRNKARSPNLNGLLRPSSNEFQNYLDGSSS
jgi:hypothetical protein